MFGVNLSEFAIIAVIALIVIGPERLPHYAEQLGRFVREGRRMALGLREQVREEIGPEFDEVDWRQLDPRQYDPRRIVREALKDTLEDPTASAARKTPTRRPKTTSPSSGTKAGAGAASSAATGAASSAATGTASSAATGTANGASTPADPPPFDSDAT